jgi:hypothetical protein
MRDDARLSASHLKSATNLMRLCLATSRPGFVGVACSHFGNYHSQNGNEEKGQSDDLTFPDVLQALTKAEVAIGRAINPSVLGRDEWRRKLSEAGGFLQRVMEQPRINLIGSDDVLQQAGQFDTIQLKRKIYA